VSPLRLPAWLRRGVEAGVFAGLLSLVTVLALAWETRPSGPMMLPSGIWAWMTLALPVVSVGVLAVAYPVAMAATRGDAVLGAVTSWIVAACQLTVVTVLIDQRVLLLAAGLTVPLGALAGLLATPAAVAGLVAAQLFTPLGFGKRAGRLAVIVAGVVAAAMLVVMPALLA
jgi:hypothetical protein